MECKQCHQQYDETVDRCPYCGAPNEARQAGAQGTAQPVQDAGPGQQPQPQYQPQQPYQQPQQQYQQQPQYQQPQYQQPQYKQAQDNTAKGLSIGALVCGIVGIVTCGVPILAIVLGIAGIVMGNISKKRLPAGQTGMATAGIICGIIAIVLAVIIWIMLAVLFVGLATASYDFLNMMDYYY